MKVALLGSDGPVGGEVARRIAADPRWELLSGFPADRLASVVDAGGRVLDLRGGPPQPLPGRDAFPECALVEVGRARLFQARHLALPSAGAAAALIAAWPLLAQNLFEPDHLVVVLGEDRRSGRVTSLRDAIGDEVAIWIEALEQIPSPRLVASVVAGSIGRGVLAIVSGLVANADAGDPRVIRAALLAQPDEPGLRVCSAGELPDAARVAGSSVAEIAAATEMLVERVTAACALDPQSFLAGAAVRALVASVEPPPRGQSVRLSL